MGLFSHPLIREISIVLLLKLAVIYALWFAFFRLPEPRVTGADDIDRVLLSRPDRITPENER